MCRKFPTRRSPLNWNFGRTKVQYISALWCESWLEELLSEKKRRDRMLPGNYTPCNCFTSSHGNSTVGYHQFSERFNYPQKNGSQSKTHSASKDSEESSKGFKVYASIGETTISILVGLYWLRCSGRHFKALASLLVNRSPFQLSFLSLCVLCVCCCTSFSPSPKTYRIFQGLVPFSSSSSPLSS